MSQNYKELGQNQQSKWNMGIGIMDDQAKALERQGLLPRTFGESEISRTARRLHDTLSDAVLDLKDAPNDPEVVTYYWQTRWDVPTKLAGLDLYIKVPACDRTSGELVELSQQGRKLVYVPGMVFEPSGLLLLGVLHPELHTYYATEKMNNQALSMNEVWNPSIVNKNKQGGWFDIEAATSIEEDLNGKSLTFNQIEVEITTSGKSGQRLATYIVGSIDAKDTTGEYFDTGKGRHVYLLGSTTYNRNVLARFSDSGSLNIHHPLDAVTGRLVLGVRTEGSKQPISK